MKEIYSLLKNYWPIIFITILFFSFIDKLDDEEKEHHQVRVDMDSLIQQITLTDVQLKQLIKQNQHSNKK